MMAGINVLLIEHESVTTKGINAILSAMGYEVIATVDNEDDAMTIARHVRPDLIILDISKHCGIAWVPSAEKIREHSEIPLLLVASDSQCNGSGSTLLPPWFDYYILPVEEEKLQIHHQGGIKETFPRNPVEKMRGTFPHYCRTGG